MTSHCKTLATGAPFAALMFAIVFFAATPTARAQDDTVVLGNAGSGVRVDLSVLDDIERGSGAGDELRFPGSPVIPGETLRLHPPGAKPLLKQPRKKAVKRKAPAKKKAPKAVAGAPAPEAPAMPAPEATGAPRPVTEAPASPAPTGGADLPPPPPPAMDRTAVPPPPPPAPPAAPVASSPDVPPVTPAPRGSVDTAKAPPPPAAKMPGQMAALPKAPDLPTGAAAATRVISFAAGAATLPADAEAALKATIGELNANPALRVQLRAYAAGDKTSESQARRLSLSRALAVRSFLVNQGVQATRIDVRALGNNVPDGAPDRVDVSLVSR